MSEVRTIVTGPEEAYNYEAEVWCENQLMAVTVLHKGRLHLRIDPRADGAPWLPGGDRPPPRRRAVARGRRRPRARPGRGPATARGVLKPPRDGDRSRTAWSAPVAY